MSLLVEGGHRLVSSGTVRALTCEDVSFVRRSIPLVLMTDGAALSGVWLELLIPTVGVLPLVAHLRRFLVWFLGRRLGSSGTVT